MYLFWMNLFLSRWYHVEECYLDSPLPIWMLFCYFNLMFWDLFRQNPRRLNNPTLTPLYYHELNASVPKPALYYLGSLPSRRFLLTSYAMSTVSYYLHYILHPLLHLNLILCLLLPLLPLYHLSPTYHHIHLCPRLHRHLHLQC